MMSVRIEGVVVPGDRRGRALGFPTANVSVRGADDLPSDGIYAGTVERADGSVHLAAISIGRRPHYYEEGDRLVEVHLLDFSDDLYGERIAVVVEGRVRGQVRFASEQDLIDQIGRDVEAVRSQRP